MNARSQCVKIAERARIERFMSAIAGHVTVRTSLYFAGGATAVLYG